MKNEWGRYMNNKCVQKIIDKWLQHNNIWTRAKHKGWMSTIYEQ